MTDNVLNAAGEWRGIIIGAIILAIFAFTLALRTRGRVPSGARGHREGAGEAEGGQEVVRPDGLIDSFNGDVREGGGSLPPLILIAFPAVFLWWLGYLILNWTPR